MTFTRYAIYYAPPADAEWSRFGASWLGWDMETGRELAHPEAA
ncbi:MAG: phosphonate metabolism protein, partial [Leisingera sp.]